jgi:pimeloyl-ACP methyl ester carboxylesterase
MVATRSGWRRIYVDLPGMGRTQGPEWLTSHDQMLDFVADFIRTVAGGRCVLVGHPYGAQLVRGLLQRDGGAYLAALPLSPGRQASASSLARLEWPSTTRLVVVDTSDESV